MNCAVVAKTWFSKSVEALGLGLAHEGGVGDGAEEGEQRVDTGVGEAPGADVVLLAAVVRAREGDVLGELVAGVLERRPQGVRGLAVTSRVRTDEPDGAPLELAGVVEHGDHVPHQPPDRDAVGEEPALGAVVDARDVGPGHHQRDPLVLLGHAQQGLIGGPASGDDHEGIVVLRRGQAARLLVGGRGARREEVVVHLEPPAADAPGVVHLVGEDLQVLGEVAVVRRQPGVHERGQVGDEGRDADHVVGDAGDRPGRARPLAGRLGGGPGRAVVVIGRAAGRRSQHGQGSQSCSPTSHVSLPSRLPARAGACPQSNDRVRPALAGGLAE
jgi:hypothetical protein